MQPGQYPQQPYPQQPFPGYPPPGYPPPKKSNTTLVVVLAIVAVLVIAGLGVGVSFLFAGGDDERPVAAGGPSPTASATSAAKPDKYTKTPSCKEIEDGMTGMPPLQKEDGPASAGTSDPDLTGEKHFCTWSQDGSSRGDVGMYLWKSKTPGSGAGEDYAKTALRDEPGQALTGIGKADKAVQKDYPGNGLLQCGVKFSQGNVEVEVIVSAGDKSDTNIEGCRQNARKLAIATSQAIG